MTALRLALAVTFLTGVAGTALADPVAARTAPANAASQTWSEMSSAALPYARHDVSLPPGVTRTAVERQEGRLTASAGFLCGRQDIPVQDGHAGAYGSDPSGRFVGASVRLAFR